nr:flagellar hook-length control protein FliK [Kineobactrum salinum]
MEITALLSQRAASVSSSPAEDSAGGFANVLQSVAARSPAGGHAAPGSAAPMPRVPADAGSSGSRLPLQFTIGELQDLPPALATATDAAEPAAGDTAPGGDEMVATATDLVPEVAALADPGALSQAAAAIRTESVKPGGPATEGPQAPLRPEPAAGGTAAGSGPLPDAMVIAATAAPPAPAMPADRLQTPAVPAARGALPETRPGAAHFTTASSNLNPSPAQTMEASLTPTTAATSTTPAPGSGLPLPDVDWSRNSQAEPQRGPTESVGSTALSSSALAGTSSSAPQPAMSSLLQATLSAPVASPAWQQQLGNQLTGLAQRGRQQIELHLNPADLGPLSVSLKMDDQGPRPSSCQPTLPCAQQWNRRFPSCGRHLPSRESRWVRPPSANNSNRVPSSPAAARARLLPLR